MAGHRDCEPKVMFGTHLATHTLVTTVIFLLLLPGTVFPSSPPFVKDLPRHTPLKLGSFNRFVLECRGDGDPEPVYSWYRDGEQLTREQLDQLGLQLVEDTDHSQLEFSSPELRHQGRYHCEASNDLGLAVSSVSLVSPSAPAPAPGTSPPVFTSPPKTELKSLGSRVELDCRAEGSPAPAITWTRNGEVMEGETGPQLVIPALTQGDVANYACNASNTAGYEYKNVIVNILTTGARIKEGPRPLLVASKGSNVTLACTTEGYPQPRISWWVDGRRIAGDSDKYSVNPDTGALTLIHANMEDDGRYKCMARNHGEDSAEGELIVKSVTTIVAGPTDTTQTLGSTIRMECEVVADTSVHLAVSWKKDNIDLARAGERVYQDSNNTLVLNNITFEDSGVYTCVASSDVDSGDTESGLLTVVGTRPQLALPAQPTRLVLEGAGVELECPLEEGVPAPTVSWYRDSDPVDRSRVEVQADHKLVIYSALPGDSGIYTCKASNSEGSDFIRYQVSVSSRTSIVSEAVYVDLSAGITDGASAVFPCEVATDQSLGTDYEVTWFKDGAELRPRLAMETLAMVSEDEVAEEAGSSNRQLCEQSADGAADHVQLLTNNSLLLCHISQADVGSYHCEVNTSLGESVISAYSSVYTHQPFPWWIIIIVISVLVFILLLCIICYCKRRTMGKGYYGMDIEDGVAGRHNKSDIYYTTEDNESIMDEVDQSMLEKQNGKTPIFTPRTIRRLARVDKSIGSIGSLLDDDEYLDKGYDEDGSFRERYAE